LVDHGEKLLACIIAERFWPPARNNGLEQDPGMLRGSTWWRDGHISSNSSSATDELILHKRVSLADQNTLFYVLINGNVCSFP